MTEMNFNQQRLVSLDAMRGFVMLLLLGGGAIGHAGLWSALYAAMDHPWSQTLYQQLQYLHDLLAADPGPKGTRGTTR